MTRRGREPRSLCPPQPCERNHASAANRIPLAPDAAWKKKLGPGAGVHRPQRFSGGLGGRGAPFAQRGPQRQGTRWKNSSALAIIRQNQGLSHRETQVWTASLAANLLEQERNEEAFALMDAAFALTESGPLNELDRAILEAEYGACLWRTGQRAEGEALLRAALAVLEPRQNEKSLHLQRARRRLAEIEAASANE